MGKLLNICPRKIDTLLLLEASSAVPNTRGPSSWNSALLSLHMYTIGSRLYSIQNLGSISIDIKCQNYWLGPQCRVVPSRLRMVRPCLLVEAMIDDPIRGLGSSLFLGSLPNPCQSCPISSTTTPSSRPEQSSFPLTSVSRYPINEPNYLCRHIVCLQHVCFYDDLYLDQTCQLPTSSPVLPSTGP